MLDTDALMRIVVLHWIPVDHLNLSSMSPQTCTGMVTENTDLGAHDVSAPKHLRMVATVCSKMLFGKKCRLLRQEALCGAGLRSS